MLYYLQHIKCILWNYSKIPLFKRRINKILKFFVYSLTLLQTGLLSNIRFSDNGKSLIKIPRSVDLNVVLQARV